MMNERIKHLAKQAEEYANERTSELDKNWHIFWGEIYDEKFAELIIQECLETIEEMDPHSTKRDIDGIYSVVEKHFGVEE